MSSWVSQSHKTQHAQNLNHHLPSQTWCSSYISYIFGWTSWFLSSPTQNIIATVYFSQPRSNIHQTSTFLILYLLIITHNDPFFSFSSLRSGSYYFSIGHWIGFLTALFASNFVLIYPIYTPLPKHIFISQITCLFTILQWPSMTVTHCKNGHNFLLCKPCCNMTSQLFQSAPWIWTSFGQ